MIVPFFDYSSYHPLTRDLFFCEKGLHLLFLFSIVNNEVLVVLGQILSQCTARLGLNTSARRLYAEDGEMLLDIDDIVHYAINLYRSALADKLEAMLDKDGQSLEEKSQAGKTQPKPRRCSFATQPISQHHSPSQQHPCS